MEDKNLEQESEENRKEIEKLKKKSRRQRWINLFLIWNK